MNKSAVLIVLFFSALVLTGAGCSAPEEKVINSLIESQPADIMNEESKMEAKTAEEIANLNKKTFVFLKDVSEDNSSDFYVNLYTDSPSPKTLATVKSMQYGAAMSRLIGPELYYLNDQGGVSYLNLETLENVIIPIPRTDATNLAMSVSDFELGDGVVFYLFGGCEEGLSCEIHQFDLETQANERIYDGMRASPVGGIALLGYDAGDNSLFVSDGWGDAGNEYESVNKLDLATGEYTVLEEYRYQACGEEFGTECTEDLLEQNEAYDRYWDAQVSSTVSCGGVEIPDRSEGPVKDIEIFVGCLE